MCNDIYVTALVLRKKHCGLKYFVKLILDFVPNCLWAQSYFLPQDLLGPQGTLCSPGSRCPFSQTVPTQEEPPPPPSPLCQDNIVQYRTSPSTNTNRLQLADLAKPVIFLATTNNAWQKRIATFWHFLDCLGL